MFFQRLRLTTALKAVRPRAIALLTTTTAVAAVAGHSMLASMKEETKEQNTSPFTWLKSQMNMRWSWPTSLLAETVSETPAEPAAEGVQEEAAKEGEEECKVCPIVKMVLANPETKAVVDKIREENDLNIFEAIAVFLFMMENQLPLEEAPTIAQNLKRNIAASREREAQEAQAKANGNEAEEDKPCGCGCGGTTTDDQKSETEEGCGCSSSAATLENLQKVVDGPEYAGETAEPCGCGCGGSAAEETKETDSSSDCGCGKVASLGSLASADGSEADSSAQSGGCGCGCGGASEEADQDATKTEKKEDCGCGAKRREPLPNIEASEEPLELAMVQIITRHGIRTPTSMKKAEEFEPFACKHQHFSGVNYKEGESDKTNLYSKRYVSSGLISEQKEICGLGHLTSLGVEGLQEIGQWIHERYLKTPVANLLPKDLTGIPASTSTPFLSQPFNTDQLYVRSTDTQRTIETAEILLDRIFPERDASKAPIVINTLPENLETMYPHGSCQAFREARTEMLKNELFNDFLDHRLSGKHTRELASLVLPGLRLGGNWSGIHNSLSTRLLSDLNKVDQNATILLHSSALLSGMTYFQIYKNKTAARLGIGRFVKELVEPIDNLCKDEESKFKMLFYSGHDNTVGPLLVTLGIFDGYHPPMGSVLLLETWKNRSGKHFVRFVYNDQVAEIPGCPSFCPLEKFHERVAPYIPDNYEAECGL
eukprot:TRINITY_DN1184_c0_g1_i4.p1 TRINITY_DN1184_c0_g1~~TRINITY_DN1184_c0_g1_i4.p1  ORF type:complete len:712 (+),score=328.73 TRINITY_DN1184_c0_g1_i4:48-2183(+)